MYPVSSKKVNFVQSHVLISYLCFVELLSGEPFVPDVVSHFQATAFVLFMTKHPKNSHPSSSSFRPFFPGGSPKVLFFGGGGGEGK